MLYYFIYVRIYYIFYLRARIKQKKIIFEYRNCTIQAVEIYVTARLYFRHIYSPIDLRLPKIERTYSVHFSFWHDVTV